LLVNAILPFISVDVKHRRLPNQYSCFHCWSLLALLPTMLDRLRLTIVYRDRTRPNETYIYTILLLKNISFDSGITILMIYENVIFFK